MSKRTASLVFCALIYATASAQSLDDRIRELERRVDQLEKQAAPPAASVSASKSLSSPSEGWRQRENWRSLKRGMTESDVRSILGEPQKIDTFPSWSNWRYPDGGSTRFTGQDGRLDGWSESR